MSVDPGPISSFDNHLIEKSRKIEQYWRYISVKAIFGRKNQSCEWSVPTCAEEKKKNDKIADLSAIYRDISRYVEIYRDMSLILSKFHPF